MGDCHFASSHILNEKVMTTSNLFLEYCKLSVWTSSKQIYIQYISISIFAS